MFGRNANDDKNLHFTMGKCDDLNLKKQMEIIPLCGLVYCLLNAIFIVFLFAVFPILFHGELEV